MNGKAVTKTVDPRTLLVQFLRETLGLTGTHVGCDTAQCGACTVHMDGRRSSRASILAAQVQGSEMTTIEGLAKDGKLHPMQEAFRECHGLQCGFCTPGMMMSAVQLLSPSATRRSSAATSPGPWGRRRRPPRAGICRLRRRPSNSTATSSRSCGPGWKSPPTAPK